MATPSHDQRRRIFDTLVPLLPTLYDMQIVQVIGTDLQLDAPPQSLWLASQLRSAGHSDININAVFFDSPLSFSAALRKYLDEMGETRPCTPTSEPLRAIIAPRRWEAAPAAQHHIHASRRFIMVVKGREAPFAELGSQLPTTALPAHEPILWQA